MFNKKIQILKQFNKNFSVFTKIKEFFKYASDTNTFSSNVNPETIKAEYEQVDTILKKKRQNREDLICKI
jgi:hypothetical protein